MKLKAKFNSNATIERESRAHYHSMGKKAPVPTISMRRVKKAYMKAMDNIPPAGWLERAINRETFREMMEYANRQYYVHP